MRWIAERINYVADDDELVSGGEKLMALISQLSLEIAPGHTQSGVN